MVNDCSTCAALCCKYVATEIEKPEDREDFHHLRWFLMHNDVVVHFDEEDGWFVEFKTVCKNLAEDNLCLIHKMHPNNNGKSPAKYDQPDICKKHSPSDCDRNDEGIAYTHTFTNVGAFEKFIEERFPEIITKEPSDEEEIDLITLNDEKIDELISKLQKLKEIKEFEFEDTDKDEFAFEYKA
jgi:uncharacterized protein